MSSTSAVYTNIHVTVLACPSCCFVGGCRDFGPVTGLVYLVRQGGALQSAYVDGHISCICFGTCDWIFDSMTYEPWGVFGLVCCHGRPSFTPGSIIDEFGV